jgi:5-methyltetrahydrofolate--homocysteine methyltransferase
VETPMIGAFCRRIIPSGRFGGRDLPASPGRRLVSSAPRPGREETTMELHELTDAVIGGDARAAEALTRTVLAGGVDPETIVNDGLIAAMHVVGERFGRGEIYVPEMLLSARAMQTSLAILEPLLADRAQASQGTVVLGTVTGDVHDIGKNIVGIMLKGSGFVVHDLGVDVPPGRFVDAVREHEPDVIGLSALLTTTMPGMRAVVEALEEAGVRDRVKVIVGGAPVTEDFAGSIGADGYGRDAGAAAEKARQLVAER